VRAHENLLNAHSIDLACDHGHRLWSKRDTNRRPCPIQRLYSRGIDTLFTRKLPNSNANDLCYRNLILFPNNDSDNRDSSKQSFIFISLYSEWL
jgi:hypothetical protein